MWTILSVCFITVTSIYGITEILREFWLWFTRPKEDPPGFTVVILKNDIFKEQLYFYEESLSWESRKRFLGIIAVTGNLNEKNKKEAKEIIASKHNIISEKEALDILFPKGKDV